jgi:DNA topoisomerase I
MGKDLVIVESPAKIKTLKKLMGPKFSFASSVGHIRDLPQKGFGIDIENDFEPQYTNLPDKKDVIQKLKKAAKEADSVYLSPDPDREGEAIAWHIASILPKGTKFKRMTFNSITKTAVLEALKHCRDIDMTLVNAQQARRLLDRIVGYKISPILTKKIRRGKSGTSAGRVQSIALKLVVDREKDILSFQPVEYWNISSLLNLKNNKQTFEATLYSVDGKKVEKEKKEKKDVYLISSEKVAKKIVAQLEKAIYTVGDVTKKEKKRHPVPPFITSTLQQEASRHYGYAVSRTMSIAQGLYEGIDLGKEGTEGLITYMRTDSVQVSSEGISAARSYIDKTFGKDLLPDKPRLYKSKKSAQEAHEAIRPTNMYHTPDMLKPYLTPDQFKLYLLIWKRFVSSQMKSAIYDTISADITTDKEIVLRTTGSIIKFPGFLKLYEEKTDQKEEVPAESKKLPPLEKGQKLSLQEVLSSQSHTKPPARFTEASLVKELEKSGVGRPSTYAAIMNKIQNREYTTKQQGTLKPTELGQIIAQMLEENFPPIMNIGFTAAMEDDLELVAENKREWKGLIREFWQEFLPMVTKAEKDAQVPKILTDIKCPKCQKPLQKIWSKNKYFYGCSNYPECDYTTPIEALDFNKDDYEKGFNWEQKCPKCGAEMTIRYGRYGVFLGCSKYPKCQGIVNVPKKGEELLDPKDRPNCPAIGCDGKIIMRRSRYGKIFFSCTNYPDCNVIVNNLDDLEKKYDKDYKKTPYVKPTKSGKRSGGAKRTFPLSDELASLLGEKELSRGDVIKKTWEYIKKHDLQDKDNKRTINPDSKLAKVFGNKNPIDMMKLSGILGKHLKK